MAAPLWSTEQWFVPAESAFPDSPHTVPERVPLDPEQAARYWCLWDNHPLEPGAPVHTILLAYHPPQIIHVVGTSSDRVHFVREGLSLRDAQAAVAERRCDVVPGNDWTTEGIFCSPGCALAYRQAFPRPEYGDHELLWAERWRQRVGTDPPAVVAAPHYSLLQRHGGPLSLEEFRRIAGAEDGPALVVHSSTAVHSPFGATFRTQRVYEISHVTPEGHANRARARAAASAGGNEPAGR